MGKPRSKTKTKKKYYQLNDRIKAETIRVVDDKAAQLGVMTKEEAISLAEEKGLDLVMVAPRANPPVVKMIDFSKFKYQEKVKHSQSKKSQKSVEIKEIRFTPFIAQGDYAMRMKKAREFLEAGNKVKLNVKFVGRQITRKQFGRDLIDKAVDELSDVATLEREPSFQGKILSCQLQSKK